MIFGARFLKALMTSLAKILTRVNTAGSNRPRQVSAAEARVLKFTLERGLQLMTGFLAVLSNLPQPITTPRAFSLRLCYFSHDTLTTFTPTRPAHMKANRLNSATLSVEMPASPQNLSSITLRIAQPTQSVMDGDDDMDSSPDLDTDLRNPFPQSFRYSNEISCRRSHF